MPPRKAGGRAGGFRPDIQGLRAIAVSMVVIYHLRPSLLPGGFAGVDVFFVISGYLITGHLWRGYRKTGSVSLLDFWGRRARRLVPAAALVLLVTWLVARVVEPVTELPDIAAQIRASALYFQNWQLASDAVNYLQADGPATPVQHFWSLSVEEQFYLVWPLLFGLAALVAIAIGRAGRSGGRRRGRHHSALPASSRRAGLVTVALLTTALVACSLAYSVYDTRTDPAAAYFVTTTRMWELGLGGLLAMVPDSLRQADRPPRLARLGRPGGGDLLGVRAERGVTVPRLDRAAAGRRRGRDDRGRRRRGTARPGAADVGAADGVPRRHLLLALPVALADHQPVQRVARQGTRPGGRAGPRRRRRPAGLAHEGLRGGQGPAVVPAQRARLAVGVGRAGRRGPGRPGLGVPGQPGHLERTAAPTGYPGAAALASKTTVGVPPEPILPPIQDATMDMPKYWLDNCLDANSAVTEKVCTFGDTKNPVLTVAMVGDSIDGNWFPALEQMALQRHWKLVTDLHGTCEWTATMMVDTSGIPNTACQQWGQAALTDLVTKIKPNVVITSGLPEDGTVGHPTPGPAAFTAIGVGMAQYWTDLEKHGIDVVAIKETPLINFPEPDCIAKYGPSSPKCAVPRAKAVPPDPPTVRASRDTGGKVKVINMDNFICGPQECQPVVGNVLVYLDGRHLTAAFGQTLTKYLEPRLLKAAPQLAK